MKKKLDIKCKSCSRFLGATNKSTTLELKCSNSKCKKLDTYKIIFMTDYIRRGEHDRTN